MLNLKNNKHLFLIVFVLIIGLVLAVACTASTAGDAEPSAEEADHEASPEHNDEHGGEEGDEPLIPNPDGAAIHIISPANGATFAAADEILVQVGVENFVLGEDGNHWHIYIDGASWEMVAGGNTDQPLHSLEPGEHEILVRLGNGAHESFADGAMITVTVTE